MASPLSQLLGCLVSDEAKSSSSTDATPISTIDNTPATKPSFRMLVQGVWPMGEVALPFFTDLFDHAGAEGFVDIFSVMAVEAPTRMQVLPDTSGFAAKKQ